MKLVVAEARQWDGYPTTATVLIDWILAGGGIARYHDEPSSLSIDVPGGTAIAVPGDWIVKDDKGNFYPYEQDVFEQASKPRGDLMTRAFLLVLPAALEGLSRGAEARG